MILTILKESHRSEENAIRSYELSELTGLKGVEIREEINRLRREGHPICSSNKGYYYTNNIKEIFRTIDNLSSRVNSMSEAILGLTKGLIRGEVDYVMSEESVDEL